MIFNVTLTNTIICITVSNFKTCIQINAETFRNGVLTRYRLLSEREKYFRRAAGFGLMSTYFSYFSGNILFGFFFFFISVRML